MKKYLLTMSLLAVFVLSGCLPAQENPDGEEPSEETSTQVVFFGNTVENPNMEDCSLVYEVEREVIGESLQIITENTLKELLKGPTVTEQENGAVSFFNEVTANNLNRVEIDEAANSVYVDLKSETKTEIPNASSSCGSAQFLGSLDATLEELGFDKAYYNFDGNPVEFYNWLQLSCPEEICE